MNSPTIDTQRGLVYFGTGQNHGVPTDENSDAIFALALNDGRLVWKTQATARDTWPVLAGQKPASNAVNWDFDFSASPILVTDPQGHDILLAGQKSGEVFGLNPDNGNILWRKRLGRGGAMGGVHFGMAAAGRTLFVPMHDNDTWLETLHPAITDPGKPGLYAVDAFSGTAKWSVPVHKHCQPPRRCLGYSAAITAIPGAVFAARRDGELQAFNSRNGALLWSFDTVQEFTTLNGDLARGGDIAGPGPVIVDGMVYINSGYGIYGGVPGNVLLAFSVGGGDEP